MFRVLNYSLGSTPCTSLIAYTLLILLCGAISIIQSDHVGDLHLYSPILQNSRLSSHAAILHNKPVGHNWGERGDNGVNVRVLTIYTVEYLHRTFDIPHLRIYKFVDMLSIFIFLYLLFFFIRMQLSIELCLISVLFISTIMPLTYSYHSFHPYDRVGLLLWLLFVWAVRMDHFYLTIPVLLLAVLNKYDAVVLPGLYFFAHVSRVKFFRVAGRTSLLFALGFGLYLLLRTLLPGGFVERDIVETAMGNLDMLLRMGVRYPPFLAFGLPICLAIYGWRAGDQFSRAGFLMALAILLGPMLLATRFEEVRAQMGAMLLLLPLALAGLNRALAQCRRNKAMTANDVVSG